MGRKEGQGYGLLQGMEGGLANHKLLQPPGILGCYIAWVNKVREPWAGITLLLDQVIATIGKMKTGHQWWLFLVRKNLS